MSVAVSCQCGSTYELRDEFRGTTVRCPRCGAASLAGGDALQSDSVFDRDLYLLRQKAIAINEKYYVSDEQGRPLLFVERPRHLLRILLAIFGGIAAGLVVGFALGSIGVAAGDGLVGSTLLVLTPLLAIASFIVVAMAISPKRHVTFYRGQDATAPRVLEVIQDYKVRLIDMTYTVNDPAGGKIGTLRKNYLYNFFRKRWDILDVNGQPICVVREDSIILSLLRRVLGPLFGLLRTNFIFLANDERELGEFKRKFTILDRYILDLTNDRIRSLDRRLAVAASVMLDTGERR